MHIVLALLTSIVTILYLLDRAGIDIGWLNPFQWRRRRQWSNRYHGDPIYSVEDPLHIAALLVIGVAKIAGDVTSEQKRVVLEQFQSRFSMDSKEASELYGAAAHLLSAPQLVGNQLQELADRNTNTFSEEQAESMLEMINAVAAAEGALSQEQRGFISAMASKFRPSEKSDSPWG